jgi:GR25 family glycosyltransferase involved in LPS biosynthesis
MRRGESRILSSPVGNAENPEPSNDVWSFFDRIYCISLKERPDRRAQAFSQFKRVGLANRVNNVEFDRHPTDREQGIYESHMACIRRGLAEGAVHILIFEDDVVFERFSPARLDAALSFLRRQPEWKILFLGCLVKSSRATETPEVRKVAYRCLAHAYALHRSCAEQLVEKSWSGIPFDAVLSGIKDGLFACHPSFAFQSNAASDNLRLRKLDTFRRWCGGLRRIQKLNEWCHCHKALLAAVHLAGLGVLLWLVVTWKEAAP